MKHIPLIILIVVIIIFCFVNNLLSKKENFSTSGPQYYCGLYSDSRNCNSDQSCTWSVVSGVGTPGTKTQSYHYCTVKPQSS